MIVHSQTANRYVAEIPGLRLSASDSISPTLDQIRSNIAFVKRPV
jgi:hypothetical protein